MADDFDNWYAGHAKKWKLNPNPDDPRHFYDYRTAYKQGFRPDESGHMDSRFKAKGHPREVIDGVNTRTGERVEVAKPAQDRDLTVGQFQNILRTFGRLKRGQDPRPRRDFKELLYPMSDYYDNVSKTKPYNQTEYMQYLFKEKDIPEDLLKMVPKLRY